jgi:AraC-like DNA-binding protein
MQDRMQWVPGALGIERMQATLSGSPFGAHRHDTYGVGITLAGVQTFRYRGREWHCLPGQVHILHPDEMHDGRAGTQAPFSYRILYVDPALVRAAIGRAALPFVREPVREHLGAWPDLWDFDAPLDETEGVDLVTRIIDLLQADQAPAPAVALIERGGLRRVHDLVAGCPEQSHAMSELERVAGLDRWTLARQFRAAYGTSPSRFRTMRRLDLVRARLQAGAPLAAAAADAGFADQSHMTRLFKRTYGITPGAWLAASGHGERPGS